MELYIRHVKGAKKLDFTYHSISMGLCRSAFSNQSFEKLVFGVSVFF